MHLGEEVEYSITTNLDWISSYLAKFVVLEYVTYIL